MLGVPSFLIGSQLLRNISKVRFGLSSKRAFLEIKGWRNNWSEANFVRTDGAIAVHQTGKFFTLVVPIDLRTDESEDEEAISFPRLSNSDLDAGITVLNTIVGVLAP